MICDVSPPWDCSLGIPHSIANWCLGIAIVSMKRATGLESEASGQARDSCYSPSHFICPLVLVRSVSVAFVRDRVSNFFSKLRIFIPNCSRFVALPSPTAWSVSYRLISVG